MAKMGYKARKRWALVILLIGLPAYILIMVNILDRDPRPPILVELLLYLGSGVLWAFPLKWVFLGIGQADPDAPQERDDP